MQQDGQGAHPNEVCGWLGASRALVLSPNIKLQCLFRTWSSTLLQSSNEVFTYGISGAFWYAAGAVLQVRVQPRLLYWWSCCRPNMFSIGCRVLFINGLQSGCQVSASDVCSESDAPRAARCTNIRLHRHHTAATVTLRGRNCIDRWPDAAPWRRCTFLTPRCQ